MPSHVPSAQTPDGSPDRKKLPLALKIYGILLIVGALISLPVFALVIAGMVLGMQELTAQLDVNTYVIFGIYLVANAVSAVTELVFGINLLRNKRRFARQVCEVLIAINVGIFLCELMLSGTDIASALGYLVRFGILIAAMVYLDPSLSEERALQRKLRDMETRERAEDGTLGLDETGKGYIQLDLFNLFWIFVVCCVLGLVIETVYHFVVVDPGHYQNRTGMLYGPFSPIYGFGAVLMTIALNRFHKAPLIVVFLVSAVIGGAFEYLVSWFLQFAFGIVAWDYTGTFLSIDGRTNGMFMAMWGVLGCVWVKLLLPRMLKLVNLIPWNWRYSLTTVCAVLMLVNGFMTLASLDCWYQREDGKQPQNALEQFCAEHYDNQFMQDHFQSMSINPDNSTRTN
ncbi:MAG TPA: putative ABC transporter permease [Candidatus Aveggerthella stercoripullorum]|uniref:ABC transporter permease n=1 Tax=Candidatus Aveggerthella stercoripullorum TaxID=2840688 RepID=A0A9D0ZYS7_9ACTN|nr:putative ABC transporter permease [Candidatus Aveggerthella stercoripullorum]